MTVLLISTYELGHQPFGLASPAAWLRRAGFSVTVVDASREAVTDAVIASAGLAAFYLPMHTATRLALPLIENVRRVNPACRLCCFGLYAPLNEELLRSLGVESILGGEFEAELVEVAMAADVCFAEPAGASPKWPDGPARGAGPATDKGAALPRLAFIQPDRAGLPSLDRYAALRIDGERHVAGYTEASRGCKHFCRHCPIVPVYQGHFRVVPVDVVLADIRAQVAQGARHITFGDPDFFNGIGHAMRLVQEFHRRFPGVTYDATIKVEHLLAHARHLPTLAGTGCLFVTSAVEALDDEVLARLAKGHTRADFERVVGLCRDAGLTLAPTFVAFTPWTTVESYLDLLETIARLDLVAHVAPIQLALRLLIPRGSLLLSEMVEVAPASRLRRSAASAGQALSAFIGDFDPATLVYPWRHVDPRVDDLQAEVMRIVSARSGAPRQEVFDDVFGVARRRAGGESVNQAVRATPVGTHPVRARATIPYLDEPWYC